jgi:hypothetical protein
MKGHLIGICTFVEKQWRSLGDDMLMIHLKVLSIKRYSTLKGD